MTMNIIFLIDSSRCNPSNGGTFGNPKYYPGGNNDNGHPPLKYGRGNDPSTYTQQGGDVPVPVNCNEEVRIWLQDLKSQANVTFAPVGFVAMKWNNEYVTQDQLTGGDALIGDISFRDDRTDLYDYEYVTGPNSPWNPDTLNPKFWTTLHNAGLMSPVTRTPYVLVPTLGYPGRLDYGIEFYCAVNGSLIGTYEFDPAIKIG